MDAMRSLLFPGGQWETHVTGLSIRHSWAASKHHHSANVYPAPVTCQAQVLSTRFANTRHTLSKLKSCKSSSVSLTQNRCFTHSARGSQELSETSPTQRPHSVHTVHSSEMSSKDKSIETERRLVVAGAGGRNGV